MATIVIIGILAFIAYELAIFNHYQKEPPHGGKQASPETEVSPKVEDADIIGKSSFNMKLRWSGCAKDRKRLNEKRLLPKAR
jgi:hypothetical protein